MDEQGTFEELMYKALVDSPRGMTAFQMCRHHDMTLDYTAVAVVKAVMEETAEWRKLALEAAERTMPTLILRR